MKTSRIASIRAALAEADAGNFGDDIAAERDARELMPLTADPFGTDGDFIDEPTGPDDADAEWAATNQVPGENPGWVEGEPDGSAIELRTVSALDRLFDDLAADREAEARIELGCHAY